MFEILFRNFQLLVWYGLLRQLSVAEISGTFCHRRMVTNFVHAQCTSLMWFIFNLHKNNYLNLMADEEKIYG
jgi:hypothetical protein